MNAVKLAKKQKIKMKPINSKIWIIIDKEQLYKMLMNDQK